MNVWLVRHGETEWSKAGRHTSTTDLPLTHRGEAEARAAGARIGDHGFGRVFSSPLHRALDTARLAGYGDRVEISDLLVEFDYGDYEGITTRAIRAERPAWDLWRDGCPGGEHVEDVAARVTAFLAELGEPEEDVLVFGHGHTLRVLASVYFGMPPENARAFRLAPGSISILGHEHDWRALVLWNEDFTHLVEPAPLLD